MSMTVFQDTRGLGRARCSGLVDAIDERVRPSTPDTTYQ